MGIFFILLSSSCIALANLFLRKSVDVGGSTKGYLAVQLTFSFFVNILLNPVRTGFFAWSNEVLILGVISGLSLSLLMYLMGKALETGPSGLTIASLNCSNVVPAIVMAGLFGSTYGHGYAWWNALGSFLVVIGLVWAGKEKQSIAKKRFWTLFSCGAFLAHVLFLVILQLHALMKSPMSFLSGSNFFLPFHLEESFDQWYMPITFFIAASIHSFLFWKQEKRPLETKELTFGVLGGLSNGLSVFCLLVATEVAKPWENAMLFPIYSVLIITLCNCWSKALYKENVNWKATFLCLTGILVGTINWAQIY